MLVLRGRRAAGHWPSAGRCGRWRGCATKCSARTPQDLTPIAALGIPADVQPLVEAINHHVERTAPLTEARRRFIDDASHQLRTPLATLTTQVGYRAARARRRRSLRDALPAVKAQLDETVRQTNQMLSLARTDSAELELPSRVDLVALAAEVTRSWWSEARDSGIDLGFDAAECEPLRVTAHAGPAEGSLVEPAAQRDPLHAARRRRSR